MALDGANKERPIPEIEHASSLPQADRARGMLDALRRNAEAVLRARGWCVRKLVELCSCAATPERSNSGVLGWCRPAGDKKTSLKIAIRLRVSCSDHALREFDELMETMLHELSHIVHLGHNADFFELMDKLREEWEEHCAKGRVLDEAGFPTVGGQRMTDASHNPRSAADGRTLALAAAEKRAATGRLMGSGRLGGSGGGWAGLSPRERAARAAELRAQAARNGLGDEELAAVNGASSGTGAHAAKEVPPLPALPSARMGSSASQGSSCGVPSKRPRRCSCGSSTGSAVLARFCVAHSAGKEPLTAGGATAAAASSVRDPGVIAIDAELEAAMKASLATSGVTKADANQAEADLEYVLRLSAQEAARSTEDAELERVLCISAAEASSRRASLMESEVMEIIDSD